MVAAAVSKRAVNLSESLRNLLCENVGLLVDLTLVFISTAPTPQGMFDFECRLADRLRQAGLEVMQFALNHLEPGQEELSDHLTSLLRRVLSHDCARNLRLVYLTDAGHHPQEYYHSVLRNMDDPHRPGEKLAWTWIVDFFHASSRLDALANGLFKNAASATEWVRRMRHCLKHDSNAVSRILHSAAALKPKSIRGRAREEYDKAYNYLLNYRRNMDYASHQAENLPIGSGVTEAACQHAGRCSRNASSARG